MNGHTFYLWLIFSAVSFGRKGEFKKALKLLRDRMNIKLIYSRPCHNQSQGKVERYNRALRSKMEYDLRKIGQDGVERAKQLPLYQRILNNKEVIAYKTPFEIYFARNYNASRADYKTKSFLVLGGLAQLRMTVTGVRGKLWNYETELKKPRADATSRCSENNFA